MASPRSVTFSVAQGSTAAALRIAAPWPLTRTSHDLSRLPDDGGPADHRHSRDLEGAARSRAEALRPTLGRAGHRSARAGSAAAARQALLDIIERESAQIKLKAAAHRHRAEVIDDLAADRLLFDESPEGERLRRFELACGRGSWRSLDSLRKIRQATKGPLSVVHCPSPVAGSTTEALDEPESTNEPTRERRRNEDGGRKEAPNELNAAHENATNEPTVVIENVTNEPTAAHGNATNEPTGGPLSFVRCPLQVASCTAHAVVELNAFARSWEGEPPGEPRHHPARTEPRPPGQLQHHPARTEPRPPGITQGRFESANELGLLEDVTNEPCVKQRLDWLAGCGQHGSEVAGDIPIETAISLPIKGPW